MALQFNTQDMGSFDAGASREPMPDTYVPARRESNAGSGFFQLAKALDGLQGNMDKEQAKRDQLYEEQQYIYIDKVLNAIQTNGGKPLPSEELNAMFPTDMGSLMRSHILSNAGYIAGHSDSGNLFAGYDPTLDPATDLSAYNGLVSKKFEGYGPEVDPFFVSGMKKAYYNALTQRLNADAAARVTEAQDANVNGVGLRARDIISNGGSTYKNQSEGFLPSDPLPLPPPDYVPGPGSDASGAKGYRFGIISSDGKRDPANFLATAPQTQIKARQLATAFGRDLQITPSGGTQADKRSSTSQHKGDEDGEGGKAIDIYIGNMSDQERTRLVATAVALGFKGIGSYSAGDGVNTLHLDIRDEQGNGPGGLALWHRLRADKDSPWTTGPKWYQDGIKMGLNGEVPNVRVASADPTVMTDAMVDGAAPSPSLIVTPPQLPSDHAYDDRGMEVPTIRVADNSNGVVPSPYTDDPVFNRNIYNIRSQLVELAKEARTGAIGKHGALKSQKAIVSEVLAYATATGDERWLNALPWDIIPTDMMDNVNTTRNTIRTGLKTRLEAESKFDEAAQKDALEKAKLGVNSGELSADQVRQLTYKNHKGEVVAFSDSSLIDRAIAVSNGQLVTEGQSFENARQFKTQLKPIIMSGGNIKDAFIDDPRMKALTNDFTTPIDADMLKSWIINAPANLAMKDADRTKLFKEIDDMYNYGNKIISNAEYKTGFDSFVNVALQDAIKASPLGKATLPNAPQESLTSMSDEQRKGWTNLPMDVRTAYNSMVYRLTMEFSKNNNYPDIENLPVAEEQRIIQQASTYANGILNARIKELNSKDSELYGNKVTSTNSGTVFNFKVDRPDDPMFGQQINNAIVVGQYQDGPLKGTYKIQGQDQNGNTYVYDGVKPYEIEAVQYLFRDKDGKPVNFDQFKGPQYADGRDVLADALSNTNTPQAIDAANNQKPTMSEVEAEATRLREDRQAKEAVAAAQSKAEVKQLMDKAREDELRLAQQPIEAEKRMWTLEKLQISDQNVKNFMRLMSEIRKGTPSKFTLEDVQRMLDAYVDEYIKNNP